MFKHNNALCFFIGKSEDFLFPADVQLNFTMELANNGSRKCTNITIVDDNVYEEFHEFAVALIPVSPENGLTLFENATIEIEDNTGKL